MWCLSDEGHWISSLFFITTEIIPTQINIPLCELYLCIISRIHAIQFITLEKIHLFFFTFFCYQALGRILQIEVSDKISLSNVR